MSTHVVTRVSLSLPQSIKTPIIAYLHQTVEAAQDSSKREATVRNKVAEVDADVTILLENTAGQKNSVGSDFMQWSEIFSKCKQKNRFGVCFDTCHAFAAGYDLRTKKTVEKTLKNFDDAIGFEVGAWIMSQEGFFDAIKSFPGMNSFFYSWHFINNTRGINACALCCTCALICTCALWSKTGSLVLVNAGV